MYSCTNTLEQFDHNPSCSGKTHLMVFLIDIVANKLVVFGSSVDLKPSIFYAIFYAICHVFV